MNLGKQIHTLLKRQAEVYVKNLGSFKRIHTSATFDEKRNVYLPPLTYIEFDKDSRVGYDFIQYVQQINQVDLAEAERLVFDAVNNVFTAISKDGQALLDSLGYLVTFGNSYVFKPLDLSGFHYEPIEDHLSKEAEISVPEEKSEVVDEVVTAVSPSETVSESPIVNEVSEEIILEEKSEHVTDEVIQEDEDNKIVENSSFTKSDYSHMIDPSDDQQSRNSNTGTYVFLAILALAILGCVYYYMNYMNQPIQYVDDAEHSLDTTLVDSDTTSSHIGIDSTLLSHADSLSNALNPDSVKTDKVQDSQEAKQEKDEVNKFTIIIGTHKTLAQAYDQADAYHKDGHKNVRVVTPNLAKNFKRVVWDTYGTKEERDSALRYVRKHIIADAWPDVLK